MAIRNAERFKTAYALWRLGNRGNIILYRHIHIFLDKITGKLTWRSLMVVILCVRACVHVYMLKPYNFGSRSLSVAPPWSEVARFTPCCLS